MLVLRLTTLTVPALTLIVAGLALTTFVTAAAFTDLRVLQVMHVQVVTHAIHINIDRQWGFFQLELASISVYR